MPDTAAAALDHVYKAPHPFVLAKSLDHVDKHGRRFIGLAPFALIASAGPGGVDVSPRGGPPGFVRVSDDGKSIFMPDRPGNNRLDTLRNIADGDGVVGMIFMIPGIDDCYRVNGVAALDVHPTLTATFEDFGRAPASVLRIAVREAFLHCPKAMMRADLWGETYRQDRTALPTITEMVTDQLGLELKVGTREEQAASDRKHL